MTRVKSCLSAFMALLLALAMMPMVAFAAGETLTIDGAATGHQYKVYQLLKGNVSGLENGSGTVANIEAGDNLKLGQDQTLQTVLDAIEGASESELGTVLNGFLDADSDPVATLTAGNPTATVEDGYYLIVDVLPTGEGAVEGDVASRFIAAVTGPTTIKPKVSTVPELSKVITQDNAVNNRPIDADGKINAAGIGDIVKFQLDSAVPEMTGYAPYKFVVHDVLDDGFTLIEDDVDNPIEFVIGGTTLLAGTDYTFVKEGQHFTLTVADLSGYAQGAPIYVKYAARVNGNAQIWNQGNTAAVNRNAAWLEYSNDPKNPGVTGTTTQQRTYTYVTQLTINKVDENGAVLTGVEFSISGDNNQLIIKAGERYVVDPTGTWYKLNDGTYTETAPTADNSGLYESTEVKYRLERFTEEVPSSAAAANNVSYVDANGKIVFTGLGKGSYTIKETVTPEGYNTIADMAFVIDATYEWDGVNDPVITWTSTNNEVTLGGDGFVTTIKNTKGLVLPSTGGIGTVIFTVVGAVIIIGAVAFLFARRRHSKSE